MAGLIWIFNQGDNRIGLASAPSLRCRQIASGLATPGIPVTNEFEFPDLIKLEAEIQLFLVELNPGIRTRAAEKNEVVFGLKVGGSHTPRRVCFHMVTSARNDKTENLGGDSGIHGGNAYTSERNRLHDILQVGF